MQSNFQKTLFVLLIASAALLLFKFLLPKKKILSSKKVVDTHIVVDSLMLEAIKKHEDSLLLVKKDSIIIKKDTAIAIQKPSQVVVKKDLGVNNTILTIQKHDDISVFDTFETDLTLHHFYKKLLELEKDKKAKTRIAYYGDSMNDGDLIVQDLRKLFQGKYGGKGVGFVNIYSESARSRGSVIHNFSNNWLHSSFLKRINSESLGISGYTAFTDTISKESWVSYIASSIPSKSKLYRPTLYYGKSDSAKFYIDRKGVRTEIELKGKSILNTYKISNGALSKLKLFFKTNATSIYGINFATTNGIHIDNFSTRGNSGLGLTRLRYGLMQRFQKKIGYDLIILQFGTNVVSSRNKKYGWYKKGMMRVINHLKKTFTNADILVFSVADKSKKYKTEMKTDSAIYPLIKAQYFMAKETNSSFLSLYELMGGENAMVKWVEEKPIGARKDYTHFNSRGSKKIAKLIFNEFEKGFKKYKQNQPKVEIIKEKKIDSLQNTKIDTVKEFKEKKIEPKVNVLKDTI